VHDTCKDRLSVGSSQTIDSNLTEREVGSNPVLRVHVASDGRHEGEDLILGALSTAVEVLASELGHPDGLAEGRVPEIDIVNERLGANIVPVNGDTIELLICK
jgi:hypothetical protein